MVFPVALGVATSITVWVTGQVLVLAVALGWGDLGPDARGRGLVLGYVLATGAVAAVALGLGGAVCAGVLTLRDVDRTAAGRVSMLQSAALAVVVVAHGRLVGSPSPLATWVLLGGVVLGTLGGAGIARRRR